MLALMAWAVGYMEAFQAEGTGLAGALDKGVLCNPGQVLPSPALHVPIWRMRDTAEVGALMGLSCPIPSGCRGSAPWSQQFS